MDFGAFLARKSQLIGLFRVPYILIEARQVLNFLSSREFQPPKFLKKFLGFWHFEPQFPYKRVLVKKKRQVCMHAETVRFLQGFTTLRSFLQALSYNEIHRINFKLLFQIKVYRVKIFKV